MKTPPHPLRCVSAGNQRSGAFVKLLGSDNMQTPWRRITVGIAETFAKYGDSWHSGKHAGGSSLQSVAKQLHHLVQSPEHLRKMDIWELRRVAIAVNKTSGSTQVDVWGRDVDQLRSAVAKALGVDINTSSPFLDQPATTSGLTPVSGYRKRRSTGGMPTAKSTITTREDLQRYLEARPRPTNEAQLKRPLTAVYFSESVTPTRRVSIRRSAPVNGTTPGNFSSKPTIGPTPPRSQSRGQPLTPVKARPRTMRRASGYPPEAQDTTGALKDLYSRSPSKSSTTSMSSSGRSRMSWMGSQRLLDVVREEE